MAKITLHAAPTLGGADIAIGDNRIVERDDLALVSLALPLGGETAVADALQAGWSLDIPAPNCTTLHDQTRALRTAADQIMLLFAHPTPDAEQAVQAKLDGAAYTTDQTDVWVMLEVSGPDTLSALERLCPIDLHTDAFPSGACARTVMEHMGAMILRLDDARFLLLSARSSGRDFLHAVQTSFEVVQS